MAEVFHTGELAAALDAAAADKFPLNDLPNDLLVSVFEAVGDLRWVRHTVPLVCKAWAELYRSQNASPLHETLEVDFGKELESAAAREGRPRPRTGPCASAEEREWTDRHPVHASRVISWTDRRADWVRKLHLDGKYSGAFEDFSPEDLGTLVAVVGSSLTELWIGPYLEEYRTSYSELCQRPFWESMRASVISAGQLRSLVVRGAEASESDFEPLGQLAGSLEELVLHAFGLSRFPASLCALTELRRLELIGYQGIPAIPAQISSLKKLKELKLQSCGLLSLPKELGELSGLTKLDFKDNMLGNAPQDEAFPAELGRMKSLRELHLRVCRLRAVPAFVGELESLELLDLLGNSNLGNAPQDEAFPTELGRKMKSLRKLRLARCELRAVPAFVGELESLEDLDLEGNSNLGNAPRDEAFAAELGRMKPLRELRLVGCRLRAVPAFVGELESLEVLDLSYNDELAYTTLDVLVEGCPRLREVKLLKLPIPRLWTPIPRPWTPQSRAPLEAFKAKLLAQNPDAQVYE